MPPHRILHTTAFRLAASYVTVFAMAVAVLGAVTYFVTVGALERQLDSRISRETNALRAVYDTRGVPGLLSTVVKHEASHPNGALDYAVIVGTNKRAGHLTKWPAVRGWSKLAYPEQDGDIGARLFLVSDLGRELTLVVAADPEQIDEVKQAILDGFLSAFGAVLLLGSIGAIVLSLALLKRVDVIRRTADAIIAGDLSRRIPLQGTGDDFDRLSWTLNNMLDRIDELMESLREVSAHIAHDLKTPLARLRQRLEAAQREASGERQAEVEAAIAQVDGILATFSALLRIAQIESGTRRAGFTSVDLREIVATVVEAFAPVAEDTGHALTTDIVPGVWAIGDRELLTQMFANLLENAISHTPKGTRIAVALSQKDGRAIATVSDQGPGVPAAERERIFRRFHRLEQSQATAGSGLGLSLVKAVAEIHAITLVAEDAGPGLRITLEFPPGAQPGLTPGAALTKTEKPGRSQCASPPQTTP